MRSIPKLELIVKFLLSKGWYRGNKDETYQYFVPPVTIGFIESDFQYALPVSDSYLDYQEYTYRIVSSIAELYEMNKWYLLDVLSQSVAQIREDVAFKQALLEVIER